MKSLKGLFDKAVDKISASMGEGEADINKRIAFLQQIDKKTEQFAQDVAAGGGDRGTQIDAIFAVQQELNKAMHQRLMHMRDLHPFADSRDLQKKDAFYKAMLDKREKLQDIKEVVIGGSGPGRVLLDVTRIIAADKQAKKPKPK